MKKTILLLLLYVCHVNAQDTKVKAYISETKTISFEQYDLIKKINEFYPEILVSQSVINNYYIDLYKDKYFAYGHVNWFKNYVIMVQYIIKNDDLQYNYLIIRKIIYT